ncbi:MAG: DNA translocase FtsK 4TM domain-containing protein [Candidatus Saccharibacteria bacterium]|nr:DNA translocase FtsK 4TM domain-containing protein [Candidatus Saccharibacteria bacterium]
MAKRKKKTTKKKSRQKSEAQEHSTFWSLSLAVVLVVAALFLLLGGFGAGGPLPVGMFDAAHNVFGIAAYLVPIALVYFSYWKFKSEDSRIPLAKFVSMSGALLLASGWLHVTFAKKVNGEVISERGGWFGEVLGGSALTALNKAPASVMFLVFFILAVFLTFSISPRVLLKLADLLKSKRREDTDLADLKAQSESKGLKLNEGVPVERGAEEDNVLPRKKALKNSAEKLTATESHEALTVVSDPDWQFPGMDLLNKKQDKADAGDVEGNADIIKETMANFNINVEMEGANIGPRVTQYTLKPPTGVKLTKITALENNLALDLAATSIRIEAPIPGKRLVGIEVPNVKPATVRFSGMLESSEWKSERGDISFVLGRDIAGQPLVNDLSKMPHLLIAGQTGSGKSVMINTFLTSLLYRNSPSDMKLILVDPKQVELQPYNDIPHLLTPVINEPEKCISALKWAVAEMERRLKTMSEVNRRNIVEYNKLKKDEPMPYIVVVIDELADLMMAAARDVEALVVRLAQKARAAGIHLVLATQRPSVDVITGLIKANVPARIAFTTASGVDSKIILDGVGAEKLLGQGDMLFTTANMPKPMRAQAAFISDEETGKVTDFVRMQREPNYDDEVVSQPVQLDGKGGVVAPSSMNDADDDMYKDAVQVVVDGNKASTSMLQRRLRIGYGRASRLIETMEEQGIIGPADGSRPRDVLVSSMSDVFGGGTDETEDDEMYDENFS